MAEYMVEGYKTPYKSIVKARAAAYRLYVQKKGRKDIRILEKIAPNVYSEEFVVIKHPQIVGEVGIYCHETNKVARLDSDGLVYNWENMGTRR